MKEKGFYLKLIKVQFKKNSSFDNVFETLWKKKIKKSENKTVKDKGEKNQRNRGIISQLYNCAQNC